MIQLTSVMVGMLGGPALMVLTVLSIERQPRSLAFLTDMTGLDGDKTLHKAVRKLKTLGYITEIKNLKGNKELYYQIVDGFQQLPLMAEELPEEVTPAEDVIDLHSCDYPESGPAKEMGANRKNDDLLHHACMHDSESESIDINNENHACMHGDDRNIYDLEAHDPEADRLEELEDVLVSLGFRDPGLSRLRTQPGLTARVVRYHVKTAPGQGAALHRIERGWNVPEDWERSRGSYVSGEFAEFIQH